MSTLSRDGMRRLLLAIWFLFLIANLGVVLFLYLSDWIGSDNFKQALNEINLSYAPYLGVILAFYWSERRSRPKPAGAAGSEDRTAFYLAVACTLLWNTILSVFFFRLLFLSGTVEDSLARIADLRGIFTWFLAGSLGLYFGTRP